MVLSILLTVSHGIHEDGLWAETFPHVSEHSFYTRVTWTQFAVLLDYSG
jgi:hypothetical protein